MLMTSGVLDELVILIHNSSKQDKKVPVFFEKDVLLCMSENRERGIASSRRKQSEGSASVMAYLALHGQMLIGARRPVRSAMVAA
ncbi:hypothetical protein NPIL_264751 [Nephila pilipes]|uniref:Uncharacterized protein n=1 Tax=Nephila pilipes TaxID=299642 RepID=A0A8X6TS37_NEPPI|nr:hypothetical protein NPIL_264751 [Nephila pilipes]